MDQKIIKCNKALNVLKSVGGISWGADPKIMLNIFKSLVMSQMDYANGLFSPHIKYPWKKLESIQFQAIRYSLGLMRTTPTNVLLCEAGAMPYLLRAKLLTDKGILSNTRMILFIRP